MDVSDIRNRKGQRIDAAYHSTERDDLLVIIGHGVTGNKDRPLIVGIAKELADRGFPVLRISFAGNGDSEGRFEDVTITSETEDLIDLLDQFSEDRKIIYAGHSMGAAVGALVAAREPQRIHKFVSIAGMVNVEDFFHREFGDQKPGEGHMWDEPGCPLSQAAVDDAEAIDSTLPAISRVAQASLFIHGTADDLVPVSDTIAGLQAAAREPQYLELESEGHTFSESAYPKIADAIAELINSEE